MKMNMKKMQEHKFTLKELFAQIEESHIFELADNQSEIDTFEKHCGYELPEDLKEFYKRYKTVQLFPYKGGWLYRFVRINEIHMTGLDIFGEEYEKDRSLSKDSTYSWFTICDLMDGNYIGINLLAESNGQWKYIDCFHETYGSPGECEVIAKSFTELLGQCLQSGESLFYLEKDFQGYGDALEITPDTAIQRIEPVKSKWGWIGEFIRQRKHPYIQAGWRVEFAQPNNSHREFFADRDYGGKEKSFDAAKQYLEKTKK